MALVPSLDINLSRDLSVGEGDHDVLNNPPTFGQPDDKAKRSAPVANNLILNFERQRLRAHTRDESRYDILAAHYVWCTRRRLMPVFDPLSIIGVEARPFDRVAFFASSLK